MTTAVIEDREGRSSGADQNADAAEYLQSLQSLTGELERAMHAIAHNALSDLEDSLHHQQVLGTQLGRLAQNMTAHGSSNEADEAASPSHMQADADMMRRIHHAAGTLERLNQRYAALIQHSSHSLALMASLFNSFQGTFQEASGPRSKYQTWSCQM